MTVGATFVSDSVLLCACPINPLIVQQSLVIDVSLNSQDYTGTGKAFAIYAPIVLKSISPYSGAMSGQERVTAVGQNFVNGAGLVMVFGTQSAPGTILSRSLVVANSPSKSTVESVQVYLSNNGGLDRSEPKVFDYFSDGFQCVSASSCGSKGTCVSQRCVCLSGYAGYMCTAWPAISNILPSIGYPQGGEMVTLTGLNLGGDCCGAPTNNYKVGRCPSHALSYPSSFDRRASCSL